MKQYLGIIITVFYALAIRVLAAYNFLEINSINFFVIVPFILAYIPFAIHSPQFIKSNWKVICFPLISVLLFLSIAVVTKLEDLACFLIIGIPYIVISVLISLTLKYYILNKTENKVNKNVFPLLLIVPFALGFIEKELPKKQTNFTISNSVIIQKQAFAIYPNLLQVPNLSNTNSKSFINYLGIPQPVYSTYNKQTNTRVGYFENGMLLNETVTENSKKDKIIFNINTNSSNLATSPTIRHILKDKIVQFNSIAYLLTPMGDNTTKVTLITKVNLHSNLSYYGYVWSTIIINNFEKTLLNSLKQIIEKQP